MEFDVILEKLAANKARQAVRPKMTLLPLESSVPHINSRRNRDDRRRRAAGRRESAGADVGDEQVAQGRVAHPPRDCHPPRHHDVRGAVYEPGGVVPQYPRILLQVGRLNFRGLVLDYIDADICK